MEIYINGEHVEFTLEQENSLQEVMASLENFLQVHNYFISEILIGGKEIPLMEAFKSDLPIVDIASIEISVLSVPEKSQEMLRHLAEKIDGLLSLNEDQLLTQKEDILFELQQFYNSIDSISNFLLVPFAYVFDHTRFMKIDMERFSFYIKNLGEKIRDEEEFSRIFFSYVHIILKNMKELYLSQILSIYQLLFQNQEEYLKNSFLKDMKESVEQVEKVLGDVGNITTLFQMGDDEGGIRGLERLLTLYEFASQLVLRCSFLKSIDVENAGEIQEKIQKNIQDMSEALTKKDIVNLCDILEYEYTVHFRELLELLPEENLYLYG